METLRPDADSFVEEIGMLLADQGAPPMLGRVLGHLLVCEPPSQSSAELASALDASAGSISMATRQLVGSGLVRRTRRAGSRATYFQLTEGMWPTMMRHRSAQFRAVREAAERGLHALSASPNADVARLREFRDLYLFLEEEWPKLLDDWDARRQETR